MMHHCDNGTARTARIALFFLVVAMALTPGWAGGDDGLQPALRDFAGRLPHLRAQVPDVIKAAEASASRILEHPAALVHVPYTELTGLGDELTNRAGGLANALPPESRRKLATEHDIVLLSVRAWDTDGAVMLEKLAEYRQKGWMTTLIASRAGAPEDLDSAGATFFIDNGAPGAAAEHGRINVLANTALAWMWCCEYVSAMTRQGKVPGILISIGIPGGKDHDRLIQTAQGRLQTTDTSVAIPGGELARMYVGRLHTLVADLASPPRQAQIRAAAGITADYLNRGKKVVVAGVGHLITGEQDKEYRSPFHGRHFGQVNRGELKRDFEPGDLLIWIGYSGGVNSAYHNFGKRIADAQLDVITCYTPDPRLDEPDLGEIHKPLAHIDQSWSIGDSEVRMAVPPGHMATISGINAMLILRMLDDEVVPLVKAATQPAAAPGRS
jgi:hypothetical protein